MILTGSDVRGIHERLGIQGTELAQVLSVNKATLFRWQNQEIVLTEGLPRLILEHLLKHPPRIRLQELRRHLQLDQERREIGALHLLLHAHFGKKSVRR